MEIGPWLARLFPSIEPVQWGQGCWIASTKPRGPEHNPPLYWLGRALDAVEAGGAIEQFAARLTAAHPDAACEGWSEEDQLVQDVLSDACAYAWAAEHFGRPALGEPAAEGGVDVIHVPEHEVIVAPHRLWPVRTMEELIRLVERHAEEAACAVPVEQQAEHGRIIYIDVPFNPAYARDVGYEFDLTEPVLQSIRHYAREHNLGYVLTRPFQWGNPIEEWY
jgi:hypothetical protein